MRVLLKEEIRLFLIKVVKYQGDEIIDFLKDNKFTNCTYRLQRGRIFYSSYSIIAKAGNFLKNKIGSIGICIGRFSKTGKFFILIPGEVLMEKILKKKIVPLTLKGEKIFLYGSHLSKDMIHEISNNLKKGDGIVLKGMNGLIIGLGELLKSIIFVKISRQKEMLLLNHADIGCYIRLV
jgi:60S ribosome subunit biogenesis protein NIP7